MLAILSRAQYELQLSEDVISIPFWLIKVMVWRRLASYCMYPNLFCYDYEAWWRIYATVNWVTGIRQGMRPANLIGWAHTETDPWSPLVQLMACHQFRTKKLPEPMMTVQLNGWLGTEINLKICPAKRRPFYSGLILLMATLEM